MYQLLVLVFLLLCSTSIVSAQAIDYEEATPSEFANAYLVKIGMGYDIPGGDMADRFGSNINFHLGLERLSESNWFISTEFVYRFGSEVKEDVLANFRLPSGEFLAFDGLTATTFLRMRGASLSLLGGKVIPFTSRNPQSGMKMGLGATYMSHYVRILDENQALPQVMGKYSKVYDRLTRGFGLEAYVGYQYMDLDGNLNLNIGYDFMAAMTSSVRSVNFTTNEPGDTGRRDLIHGLRVSLIIPIHSEAKGEQIYY